MEPRGEEEPCFQVLCRPGRPSGPEAGQREADPAGGEPLAGEGSNSLGSSGTEKGGDACAGGQGETSAKGTNGGVEQTNFVNCVEIKSAMAVWPGAQEAWGCVETSGLLPPF